MKKLYLTILIGVLLIGGLTAGILTSVNKEVDSTTKTKLDSVGLTDYKILDKRYDNGDIYEVCFFKEKIVNMCYTINQYREIYSKFEQTQEISVCLERGLLKKTEAEIQLEIIAREDNMIETMKGVSDAPIKQKVITEKDVTITTKGVISK